MIDSKLYEKLLKRTNTITRSNDIDFNSEILQEAFVRFYERADVENVKSIEFFMYRVICNVFIDYTRKQSKEVITDEFATLTEDEEYNLLIDIYDDIESELCKLETKDRLHFYYANLFRIYIQQGCNASRVAEATGIKINTIHKDIQQVKTYIKHKLWHVHENRSLQD